jgi:hypothetical protein
MEKDFANFGLAGFNQKADQNLWILINEKKRMKTTNKGRRTSIRE